jgi:hypothetical protein
MGRMNYLRLFGFTSSVVELERRGSMYAIADEVKRYLVMPDFFVPFFCCVLELGVHRYDEEERCRE